MYRGAISIETAILLTFLTVSISSPLSSPLSSLTSKRDWDDDYPWKYLCINEGPPREGYPAGVVSTSYFSLKHWCTSVNPGPACGCDQKDGEPTCGLDNGLENDYYNSQAARFCLIGCMCVDVSDSESMADADDATIIAPGRVAGNAARPMMVGGGASDDESDSDESMGASSSGSNNRLWVCSAANNGDPHGMECQEESSRMSEVENPAPSSSLLRPQIPMTTPTQALHGCGSIGRGTGVDFC